jgi:hypothetical protein
MMFGVLALRLSHIYKFIGLALVALTMFFLILWVDRRLHERGLPIHPDPEPAPEDASEQPAEEPARTAGENRQQEVSEYSEQQLGVSPSSQR